MLDARRYLKEIWNEHFFVRSIPFLGALMIGVTPLFPYVVFGPIASFFAVVLVSVGIILVAVSFVLFPERFFRKIHIRLLLLFLAGFTLVVLLNLRSGISLTQIIGFGVPTNTFLGLLSIGLMFWVGYVSTHSQEESFKHIAHYGVLGLIVFGVVRVVLSFFEVSTVVGFITSPLSDFIVFGVGLFLAVALALDEHSSHKKRITGLIGSILFGAYIFFSGSVLLLGAVAFGLGFLLLRSTLSEVFQKQKKVILALSLLALILVGGAFFSHQLQDLGSSLFKSTSIEIRPSPEANILLLANLYEAKPPTVLMGNGVGSFTYAWGSHAPISIQKSDFWNQDFQLGFSTASTLLVEIGFPLLLLIIVGWASVARLLFYPLSQKYSLYIVAMSASVLFVGLWFLFYTPALWLLMFTALCLGALYSVSGINTEENEITPMPLIGISALGIGFIGMVLILTSLFQGYALVSYGRAVAFLQEDPPKPAFARGEYKKSFDISGLPEVGRAQARIVSELSREALARREENQTNSEELKVLSDEMVGVSERVRAGEQRSYQSKLMFGEALLLASIIQEDPSLAEQSLQAFGTASGLAPNRVNTRFALARAYASLGQLGKAQEFALLTLTLRPEYEPAQILLKSLK